MRNVVVNNKNHAQLTLYKSGLKELGMDAVRGNYSDKEVREAGLKRLGRRAAGTVLAFSGVTGFGALAAHEINTMPTPRIEQGVQHDMERQQMQQGELSQDELHARHQIDIQQSRERAQQIAVEVKH